MPYPEDRSHDLHAIYNGDDGDDTEFLRIAIVTHLREWTAADPEACSRAIHTDATTLLGLNQS